MGSCIDTTPGLWSGQGGCNPGAGSGGQPDPQAVCAGATRATQGTWKNHRFAPIRPARFRRGFRLRLGARPSSACRLLLLARVAGGSLDVAVRAARRANIHKRARERQGAKKTDSPTATGENADAQWETPGQRQPRHGNWRSPKGRLLDREAGAGADGAGARHRRATRGGEDVSRLTSRDERHEALSASASGKRRQPIGHQGCGEEARWCGLPLFAKVAARQDGQALVDNAALVRGARVEAATSCFEHVRSERAGDSATVAVSRGDRRGGEGVR